jgi:hypothetical protein
MPRAIPPSVNITSWAAAPLVLAVVLGVVLSAGGYLHWDEPHYLYVGAYLSVPEILSGDIQSSGLANDFIFGRILHVLTVKALMLATGPGVASYALVVTFHLSLLFGTLLLIHRILRTLLPGLSETCAAIVVLALAPVIPYLGFKTMPDTQALAAAVLATWAILRCGLPGSGGVRVAWCAVACASLVVAILTKSQGVFMPASFWIAAGSVSLAGIDRRRLLWAGVLSGTLALLCSGLLLELLGIGVTRYANGFAEAFAAQLWWPFSTVYATSELGALWLLLPVALFTTRRRELTLFGIWFVVATVPFTAMFFTQIEPRHLTMNLAAAAGLIALALEVINTRVRAWWGLSARGKGVAASAAVLVLLGSDWLALSLMPHEAHLGRLRALLQQLDARYGADNYTILSPWVLNEFHLLRVLWPEMDVRGVQIHVEDDAGGRQPQRRLRDVYYRGRNVESVAELRGIGRPLVYLGTVEPIGFDMFRILGRIAPDFTARLAAKLQPTDHLYTAESRWLWDNPETQLQPVASADYYRALEVSLRPVSGGQSRLRADSVNGLARPRGAVP